MLADAGRAAGMMVGAVPVLTVTVAVPVLPPLTALTVYGPPGVALAVNTPAVDRLPPPLVLQVKVALFGWPNWSTAAAVNVSMPEGGTPPLGGDTLIELVVAFTVTLT